MFVGLLHHLLHVHQVTGVGREIVLDTLLVADVYHDTLEKTTGGTVADGYEIKEVRISPENVTVAAREEVLSQLEELPMDQIVNVKDLTETTVFQLKVQKPSEDSILYNDTVTVTAVIEAKE